MRKGSGMTVTGANSRGVPPMQAPAPGVRLSRASWWALAGLICLTTAGQVGLIVAVGSWLRRAPTVAGSATPEPVPGSGAARGDAPGDPAAASIVATAPPGPAPSPDRPSSLPVDSRAPQPPRDNGLPPAAGPPAAPRSVAGAADHRPGAPMRAEARPGPVLPAAGAADPPAGDGRSVGRELFARTWRGPTIPTATAATAWGLCTTRARASTATTRGDRAAAGPPTGTCSLSQASATCSTPAT